MADEKAPEYLGDIAKKTWDKVYKFLETEGISENGDSFLVSQYATQYEIYLEAYVHIKDKGIVQDIYEIKQDHMGDIVGRDFKGYKRNPSTQIFNDSIKNLNSIGRSLGLDKKARAELMKLLETDDDDENTVDIDSF